MSNGEENQDERFLRFLSEITGIVMAILISAFVQIEDSIKNDSIYFWYILGLPCIFLSFIFSIWAFILENRNAFQNNGRWYQRISRNRFYRVIMVLFILSLIFLLAIPYIIRSIYFWSNFKEIMCN